MKKICYNAINAPSGGNINKGGHKMPEQQIHPLLAAYDRDLHAITEKYRKEHPEWWFWYTAAKIKPTSPQKQARVEHKTEIIKPEVR